MKKFTLLIASLFLTIGAMAQTPVLHYENITTRQELSSDDANTIRNLGAMTVIADVEITNSSTPSIVLGAAADYTSTATTNGNIWALGIGGNGMRYIVRATDGGWYSRGAVSTSTVKLAYTYNYANNQTTVNYYTEGGTSQGSVTVSDAALNTFNGENAKFYIGGVGHTNSNGWYSAFAGTINSIDIYQGVLSQSEIAALCQPELPEGFVSTPNDIESGKIYTFESQRGWLMAKDGVDYVYNSKIMGTVTPSLENTYCQWIYYSTASGKYLYNVGAGKFMSANTSNMNSIPLSTTPTTGAIEFKQSTVAFYPILIGMENAAVNHNIGNANFQYGALLWSDGWTDSKWAGDAGSAHTVIEIGDADAATLSSIVSAVSAFEIGNTAAKNALGEALTNATTLFGTISVGEGVGKYSSSIAGYAEEFAQIQAYYNAITESTPIDEINAKTARVGEIVNSFSLNMPEAGKYYRLKGNSGNYIDASSLYDKNSGQMSMKSAGECNLAGTIFYLDNESHLLNYLTGTYTRNTREIGAVGDATKSVWAFSESTRTRGKYVLTDNGTAGSKNLHDNGGTRADRCSSVCGAAHDWTLEEVTELPVTVTAAGYATLYAPVALTVPAGVTAHTVTLDGEWAVLSDALVTIPANTGVVLVGTGSFDFAIAADVAEVESALEGTVAATYVADDAYVLGIVDEKVGFYTATKNQNAGAAFLNNANKAYLPKPVGAENIASYSFRFQGGATGIENVAVENGAKTIFDLTGRRVENITAPGIYIVNGKKLLVR